MAKQNIERKIAVIFATDVIERWDHHKSYFYEKYDNFKQ